jgi:mycothiol synthase
MSITDIIIDVIIRAVAPVDLAGIQGLCERALDLEPDAAELPGLLQAATSGFAVAAETDGKIIGVCYGSLAGRKPRGHIDLLAVAPLAQGGGVGRRLLTAMEDQLRGVGATEIILGASPPVYLWPGVDVRYTAMTCLAERAGYERYREAVDMAVDLTAGGLTGGGLTTRGLKAADLDVQADERRLGSAGITVRRAAVAESAPIIDWLRTGPWGQSAWPDEVALTLAGEPTRCHMACRDGAYVGFACHGSVRPGRFGPMGTLSAERGHGIGSVLLRRCLADIKSGGLPLAVIGWVGPIPFYCRAVGARIERVYWLYRKAV